MSGLLGAGLTLLSAAENILGSASVTIGGIGLASTEVPEQIPWGGEQAVSVKRLPGGGKVVDVLGAYERDIQWSGLFSGTNAVSRARSIDALRKAGKQITLVWGTFSRTVVIKTFEPDYKSIGYLIPYSITLEVITEQDSNPTSILDSITDDIGNALGIPGLSADITSALTTAQAALPVVGVLARGSSAFLGLSSALTSAQSVASLAQVSAGTIIDGASTAATAAGGVFPGSASLSAVVAARTLEASSTEALSYIGRSITNLGML
ncbi:hypothetical protein ACELLULO517_15795 [Acidisoma cellulosilytica]|uniref:Phage tail protein n=1 Tax=Acidisoma cellulosilyticum TaxID=2802395 RepID=A0A963Z378_9PROT|nr:hypothetical protein [Acidisoma cellulosilyticum]MCB8881711.1 hypothetical protein [Acidisoma cellulosilyticum]